MIKILTAFLFLWSICSRNLQIIQIKNISSQTLAAENQVSDNKLQITLVQNTTKQLNKGNGSESPAKQNINNQNQSNIFSSPKAKSDISENETKQGQDINKTDKALEGLKQLIEKAKESKGPAAIALGNANQIIIKQSKQLKKNITILDGKAAENNKTEEKINNSSSTDQKQPQNDDKNKNKKQQKIIPVSQQKNILNINININKLQGTLAPNTPNTTSSPLEKSSSPQPNPTQKQNTIKQKPTIQKQNLVIVKQANKDNVKNDATVNATLGVVPIINTTVDQKLVINQSLLKNSSTTLSQTSNIVINQTQIKIFDNKTTTKLQSPVISGDQAPKTPLNSSNMSVIQQKDTIIKNNSLPLPSSLLPTTPPSSIALSTESLVVDSNVNNQTIKTNLVVVNNTTLVSGGFSFPSFSTGIFSNITSTPINNITAPVVPLNITLPSITNTTNNNISVNIPQPTTPNITNTSTTPLPILTTTPNLTTMPSIPINISRIIPSVVNVTNNFTNTTVPFVNTTIIPFINTTIPIINVTIAPINTTVNRTSIVNTTPIINNTIPATSTINITNTSAIPLPRNTTTSTTTTTTTTTNSTPPNTFNLPTVPKGASPFTIGGPGILDAEIGPPLKSSNTGDRGIFLNTNNQFLRNSPRFRVINSLLFSNNFKPGLIQLKNIKRNINGSGNNQLNFNFGMINTSLVRKCKANYIDGRSIPVSNLPSPRLISNTIGAARKPINRNKNNVTLAFTLWGQFIDHDMQQTPVTQNEAFHIRIPRCDKQLDFDCNGSRVIPFSRTVPAPGSSIRIPINSVTTWIDASMIYGSTEQKARKLRTFRGGQMKSDIFRMLPEGERVKPIVNELLSRGLDKNIPNQTMDAGDDRSNENLVLLGFHTIFLREHNRICELVNRKLLGLNDEDVYTIAKNYVTGLIQKITYDQYLPVLLGQKGYNNFIGEYKGYDNKINPTLQVQFTTAGHRFGHALVVNQIPLHNMFGDKVETIRMDGALFRPDLMTNFNLQRILRGVTRTITKERDGQFVDQLRNLLVIAPQLRSVRMDLLAINIERGRDHGLPDFNTLRQCYGLKKLTDFSQFTQQSRKNQQIRTAYGNINSVDSYIGIQAQKSFQDSVLGETGIAIVGNAFKKLRDGDRFWYERVFPPQIVEEIKSAKLSEVILRNTGMMQLQWDVFHYNFGNAD